MKCMWKSLLDLLPPRLQAGAQRIGEKHLLELRLRQGQIPQYITPAGPVPGQSPPVRREELEGIVQVASRYSAYAASGLSQGYLTAPGGHRLGLCGTAVLRDGQVTGIREISSLCIRVARDVSGIGMGLAQNLEGSGLILGKPGSGKTTLLRDVIRCIGKTEQIAVVDERGELFPMDGGRSVFEKPGQVDVLTGCPKGQGVEMVLRAMGPGWIAVDEITAAADCLAMEQASYCGVRFLASAHAGSLRELRQRPVYARLLDMGIFENYALLGQQWKYTVGRLTK